MFLFEHRLVDEHSLFGQDIYLVELVEDNVLVEDIVLEEDIVLVEDIDLVDNYINAHIFRLVFFNKSNKCINVLNK